MRQWETEVGGEELLDVRSSDVDGLLNLGDSENLQVVGPSARASRAFRGEAEKCKSFNTGFRRLHHSALGEWSAVGRSSTWTDLNRAACFEAMSM